jgi:transcriptional accessory protein Tex/SPT6
MAKQYLRNENEQPLTVIKDMCTYTAMELSAEPDIRRGLKKHIYEYGVIKSQPTEKGLKELDVFHPSYRIKRVNKKLSDI